LATNAGASRRAAWQRAGGWLARRREVAPAVRRRASLPQCKTCCSALASDRRNVAAARCAAFMAAGGHAARHASASRPAAAVCRGTVELRLPLRSRRQPGATRATPSSARSCAACELGAACASAVRERV
jgi:hypothetical protein